jgi:hypothetical protein
MVEAPRQKFTKVEISPLLFELDQICKLYFVDLIVANRMQKTARYFVVSST